RIYGIWSPIAEGKICTHAVKWKMVRKAVDVQEAAADQGACAPWTRGNNCLLHNKRNILRIMNDFTPPKNHFRRFKRVDFIRTNYPPKRL
ncbi:replication endonuclease, partial [Escherichia coli]|nr:replication endonuclease [Escherichia coli]